jgi:hypothetical protein
MRVTGLTTDQLSGLDVRELKRAGLISPGQELVCVKVNFRKRGEERVVEVEGRLRLVWPPCNYGGHTRPWFLCPGEGCGRCVAIVYGPPSPRCVACV